MAFFGRFTKAWLVVLVLAGAARAATSEFRIEARQFDSGNVRVSLPGQDYAEGESCIWNGGELPNRAEYVLEFPVTAEYTLFVLYAAEASRPVEIYLDDQKVHTGLARTTGSWSTKSARWERQCVLQIARGTHTIALECQGPMPHICALRVQASVPFPEGWTLKRLSPEQRVAKARIKAARTALERMNPAAVRRAVEDLERGYPGRYDGTAQRRALAGLEHEREALLKSLDEGKLEAVDPSKKLLSVVRSALVANPLLDFDGLLVVRRRLGGKARQATEGDAGFVPANYLTHVAIAKGGWDNEIAVLRNFRGQAKFDRIYRPDKGQIVRDVRLEFDGDRMLFSSIDATGRWGLFEIRSDGTGLKQLTPGGYPDVDFFDGCYLPDGRIVLCSTASYIGLPCLEGHGQVASLYLLDPKAKALRQLTFDQDSDNDPTVLNDGRVLYQRWEYSDIPHYFSRRRMAMNPDGTSQMALYGSNSWFPTAFRFARPVPDHPTRMVGIISGHHDFGDCGRLAILDPGLAGSYPFRYRPKSKEWGVEGEPIAVTPDVLPAEQSGFVQLIPGYGKPVAGTVCDAIVRDVYRKEVGSLTTHPYPLSSKYFLVSMKPSPGSLWGIWLVDVFDNATLLAEVEGEALFEPQPLARRVRPAVIADRVSPAIRTADVHIADIYAGPGLQGVPRGTVKSLRIFAYHFGYNDKAGFPSIGEHSGWDVKRVLGTAKVETDGSAFFEIPANTPLSIQPLDAEGRAVQLMRSWFVGMPGEHVSCVGCHENRMAGLPVRRSLASQRSAQALEPWYGAARPFAFAHEVYPVLEKYCVGCHQEAPKVGPRSKPSFRDAETAYATLHPYIHRAGVESDMELLAPMEYHASTSRLVQMLEKGHHGVRLADMGGEARERVYCWIDLNVPNKGSWSPPRWQNCNQQERRRELAEMFANDRTDPEAEFQAAARTFQQRAPVKFRAPTAERPVEPDGLKAQGFPMTAADARQKQQAPGGGTQRVVELGSGVTMTLRRIPAGQFVMGSLDGAADERPRTVVQVKRPFWMGVAEVTNGQYALFDPTHDTRYVDMHYMDHTVPGHIANHPDQPVARVSWQSAMQFCRWMREKTGLNVTLPSESQWEWAARAGIASQFFYGTVETDFGRFANLADQSLRWYRMGFDGPSALPRRYPYPPEMNFPLHDERYRDRWHVVDYAGQTEGNAWGLRDMVGNVSEWTRSSYHPYPYAEDDGRNADRPGERKVSRGGSWADRPVDAGSSVRRAYESWQQVFDVGFRVIIEDRDGTVEVTSAR